MRKQETTVQAFANRVWNDMLDGKSAPLDTVQLHLCETMGKLFRRSADEGLDSDQFVRTYMNSDTARQYDMDWAAIQCMGDAYMLEEVLDPEPWSEDGPSKRPDIPKNGRTYGPDAMEWTGFMYELWHLRTGEPSARIYERADAQAMATFYGRYRGMDCEQTLDKMLNGLN